MDGVGSDARDGSSAATRAMRHVGQAWILLLSVIDFEYDNESQMNYV